MSLLICNCDSDSKILAWLYSDRLHFILHKPPVDETVANGRCAIGTKNSNLAIPHILYETI